MTFSDPTNYSLPSQKEAQQQVFGGYTSKDMSDYSQAAYNYLMHQQDNALQIAMMNYMNQYNSPQYQMLQRQIAGINPYSDYGVQPAQGANIGASPTFRSNGTHAKQVQNTMNALNSLLGIAEGATKIYDYLNYGRDLSKYQLSSAIGNSNIIAEKVEQEALKTMWQNYLLGNPNVPDFSGTPQGKQYESVTSLRKVQEDKANNQIDQIRYLINTLYPSQKDRNDALKALDDERLNILQGQFGALVNIHTGNDTADMILKFFMFLLRDNSSSLMNFFLK